MKYCIYILEKRVVLYCTHELYCIVPILELERWENSSSCTSPWDPFRIALTFYIGVRNNESMDDKDSVIINLKTSASESKKYFCSYCNSRLFPLTQEDMKGAYVCTKYIIEYWPTLQSVKKSSKFDLPGPETDEHGNVIGDNDIPIAVIDDGNTELSSTTFSSKQKLPAAYEALRRVGFSWLSYDER
jgi:hypothetical protein